MGEIRRFLAFHASRFLEVRGLARPVEVIYFQPTIWESGVRGLSRLEYITGTLSPGIPVRVRSDARPDRCGLYRAWWCAEGLQRHVGRHRRPGIFEPL